MMIRRMSDGRMSDGRASQNDELMKWILWEVQKNSNQNSKEANRGEKGMSKPLVVQETNAKTVWRKGWKNQDSHQSEYYQKG
jgi:hypothetical protein